MLVYASTFFTSRDRRYLILAVQDENKHEIYKILPPSCRRCCDPTINCLQGGVTLIYSIHVFPTGHFDRPLTPNLGVWLCFSIAIVEVKDLDRSRKSFHWKALKKQLADVRPMHCIFVPRGGHSHSLPFICPWLTFEPEFGVVATFSP